MNLHILAEAPCPNCAATLKGLYSIAGRVNKHTIKSTGPGFGFWPLACGTCGTDLAECGALTITRWRLADDDQARVDAYRAKRFKTAVTA